MVLFLVLLCVTIVFGTILDMVKAGSIRWIVHSQLVLI